MMSKKLAIIEKDGDANKTKAPSYLCPTCSQNFNHSRALKAHMKTHHILSPSKPLHCLLESCSFQTFLCKDLLKHMIEQHGVKPVKCRHHACAAIFLCEAQMEAHHKKHLAYHCPECDFSCSNKVVFLRHQQDGHPGNKELCCKFCTFITYNPVEFEKHVGHLHAKEKIHHCSQCTYSTPHKRGLKRHMLKHNGEKPHMCTLCEFRCKDEAYLSKHMLTHSEDKNFMCSECGYVTKWKHYLNVHMRKHAGDLRYICDQCQYRCHRMDQLTSHKLRHQSKSLICEICAYACKRKYELRNHMLSKHSGEEKQPTVYKCKYCVYSTIYKQALQNHENCKHTKLKEFRCALCNYSSFSNVSLFLHKKKVHGYTPGDQVWLENYATKEKEKNSAQMLDFYLKPTTDLEQSHPPAPALADSCESAGNNPSSERALTPPPGDSSTEAVSQEVNEFASYGSPSVHSPKQYCTLVLTTLATAEDPFSEEPQKNRESPPLQKNDMFPLASSSEEDIVTVQDGLHEQNNSDDLCKHLSHASQVEETSEDLIEMSGVGDSSQPEENDFQQKVCFEAMKKHKKERGESMFLEGRVQMLVVPSKNVYQCDKCSYVTCKENAFKNHCQTLCLKKIRKHKLKANDPHFKQSHSLPNTNKKMLSPPQDSSERQMPKKRIRTEIEEAKKVKRHRCNRTPLLEKGNSSKEYNLEIHQQEEEACKYPTSASLVRGCVKRKAWMQKFVKIQSNYNGKRLQLQKKVHCLQNNKNNLTYQMFRHFKKGFLHTKSNFYHCQLCNFSCKQEKTLKRHVSCKHKQARLLQMYHVTFNATRQQGTHCGSQIGSHVASRKHRKHAHSLEVSSPYKHCSFSTNTDAPIESNQLDGNPLEKSANCQEKKQNPKVNQKSNLTHTCTLCLSTCKTKWLLAQHLLDKHEECSAEEKPLKCSTCKFACRHQLVLELHLRSHGSKRLYKCTDCQYSTRNKQKITWHIRVHTGEKPYKCEQCSYMCPDPSRLKLHMRVHQEEKKFLCPECGYKCKWATQLKYHMTKHTGEKPHACDKCDYRTNRADALRAHRDTQHCDTRSYVCEKCGKAFKTSFILKTHQRQHSDGRPYICGTCQKAFRWPAGLRHHYLTHTKQQPFSCRHCSYRAKQKFQVVKHLQRHHPGMSVDQGVLKDSEVAPLTLKEALEGAPDERSVNMKDGE